MLVKIKYIKTGLFIWSSNRHSSMTGSQQFVIPQQAHISEYFTFTSLYMSLLFSLVFLYSQMLQPAWNPLVCCVSYGSKLVISTIVFPRQKELLCGFRMSGSALHSSFSQENKASSLCRSRCSMWRQIEREKGRTFIWGFTQEISSHPQLDPLGRLGSQCRTLQKRAQAQGSILGLPIVEVVLERRWPSPPLKKEEGWRDEHWLHCKWCYSRGFLHLQIPCFGHR